MKEKIHYAIEAVLAVAVIILFVLQFTGNKNTSGTNMTFTGMEGASEFMSIAYIDIDSLMTTYAYSMDLNEQIAKKIENSQATFTVRARQLQKEYDDFQRKIETNSFLSRERAEAEQKSIQKKAQDLDQYQAQLEQELALERFNVQQDLRNTLIVQLAEYNKDKKYHIIIGNNDIILYSNKEYNITAEAIEYLNRRYASSTNKKTE